MQWIKYILEGRIMSMKEKRKRYNYTIKYNMEMKYTEYKGENCIYHERKILHDMKML